MMAVILAVSSATARSTAHRRRPAPSVISTAPTAPIEAASVGAATPPTMLPSTATTSSTGGTTTFHSRSHSSRRLTASRSACGSGGIHCGFHQPSSSRNTMYTAASSSPGPPQRRTACPPTAA